MGTVDSYIASLDGATASVLRHMALVVTETVPAAEQGTSYGMACFKYKGKALVSTVQRKKHFSLYPYSGKVLESLREQLGDFEISAGSGSVHFTAENPIPDPLLVDILRARILEIDTPKG